MNLSKLDILTANGMAPCDLINNFLGLSQSQHSTNAIQLCEVTAFQGRMLYIDMSEGHTWPAWKKFLTDYEDACRSVDSLSKRSVFLVFLEGKLAADAPRPANLLRVYDRPDWVDGLSIRFYAASLLRETALLGWQRKLAVEVLAELALWDPAVCEHGASKSLEDILQPKEWLEKIALTRGWNPAQAPDDLMSQWLGYRQRYEGHSRSHSAWLAISNRIDSIEARVWSGQITTLFPMIEIHRRALLGKFKKLLSVPFETGFGTVKHLEDLELNHIYEQLSAQRSGALRDACSFIRWLRDMRNALAHLSPVSPSLLLNNPFQQEFSNAQFFQEE